MSYEEVCRIFISVDGGGSGSSFIGHYSTELVLRVLNEKITDLFRTNEIEGDFGRGKQMLRQEHIFLE